jgi:hypothetical protein
MRSNRDAKIELEVEKAMYSMLQILFLGYELNSNNIGHALDAEENTAFGAVTRGLQCGFISLVRHHKYTLTEDGTREYLQALLDPRLKLDTTAFRNEVLTGMTRNGLETEIDNAVLPNNSAPVDEKKDSDIVNAIDLIMELSRFSDANNETRESIVEGINSGRVGVCNKGKPHFGIFHKKGNGYRNVCRECRKSK